MKAQKVEEGSRGFKKVQEVSIWFKKVPKVKEVSEGTKNVLECSRRF